MVVLTAKKRAFDAPLDLDLPAIPGVKVVEVPYGRAVTDIGARSLSQSVLGRALKLFRTWVRGFAGISLDPRRGWLKAASRHALNLSKEADYVVSTSGPAAAHQIACLMKKGNPRLLWVADYRDLWSQNHVANMSTRERRRTQREETATVGSYADLVTVVSEDMVKRLETLVRKPIFMVPNGFDEDSGAVRERLASLRVRAPFAPVKVVYTGTLYKGKQDPEPLLKALAELKAEGRISDGQVTVSFYGSRVDLARELKNNPAYVNFVTIEGHVERSTALAAQRGADLLLILESPEEEARGVVTGKIFEYLCAGAPILSLGSRRDYEIPMILAATRTGISLENNVSEIKVLMMRLVKGESLSFFRPDIDAILKYSRRDQAISLLGAIKAKRAAEFS